MKKRFICLIAAMQLLNASLCYNVFAEDIYIYNFSKKNTYTQNQFTDVNSEWYASSVQQAYETGLMYGNSEITFNADGNIDNAAVITIAARLHSIYNYGKENFNTNSSVWYEPYMDYAVKNNICDNQVEPNAISTRGFFAGVIGNATDSSIFTQKNVIEDGSLIDVTGWYSNTVYTFYRAGILSGNDKYGTFAPDMPITRAEVAAILSRIVKPSERVNVVLEDRPMGMCNIMEDDGSLEAYRQRAIAANLKVLLNGEEKDSNWQTDIYNYTHPEKKGIPSETIIIPKKYIDSRYNDIYDENTVVFKASHIDPSLKGEIEIPISHITYERARVFNSKSYQLSVVNTGGEVDFYGGIIINGDLKLYYPGVADTPSRTETLTYDSYTAEAQNLIDAVPYTKPIINDTQVAGYVKSVSEKNCVKSALETKAGYLSFYGGSLCIVMNKDNMYDLTNNINDTYNLNTTAFDPDSSALQEWCNANYQKYILGVYKSDNGSRIDRESILMFAQIEGYPDTKDKAAIKNWSWNGSQLTIQWKSPEIKFTNLFINKSYIDSTETENHDEDKNSGFYEEDDTYEDKIEEIAKIDGYARICNETGAAWTYYLEGYNDINFKFTRGDVIEGYAYAISLSYNGPHIAFNLNSKKACIQVWYNGTEYGKKVISIPEPIEVSDEIYLPVDAILEAIEDDGYTPDGWKDRSFEIHKI